MRLCFRCPGSVKKGISRSGYGLLGRAVLEPEAVVAGFMDVAVLGKSIEERGGHLRIAENDGPFTAAEVGGDDDAGALVAFAEQNEQQCAVGFLTSNLCPCRLLLTSRPRLMTGAGTGAISKYQPITARWPSLE